MNTQQNKIKKRQNRKRKDIGIIENKFDIKEFSLKYFSTRIFMYSKFSFPICIINSFSFPFQSFYMRMSIFKERFFELNLECMK